MHRNQPQLPVRQKGGRERQRHIEPENHRPVQMLGYDATQHRAKTAGNDPNRAGIGLVVSALARRHRIGNDRLRQRHDTAAADALQASADDQHQHARRRRTRRGTGHKDAERHQHHAAATVDVAELAIERRHDGRRQQIGDNHPGQIFEVIERTADGRQGRRYDRLVERAEKHRQRQAADDGDHLAPAELGLGGRCCSAVSCDLLLRFRRGFGRRIRCCNRHSPRPREESALALRRSGGCARDPPPVSHAGRLFGGAHPAA